MQWAWRSHLGRVLAGIQGPGGHAAHQGPALQQARGGGESAGDGLRLAAAAARQQPAQHLVQHLQALAQGALARIPLRAPCAAPSSQILLSCKRDSMWCSSCRRSDRALLPRSPCAAPTGYDKTVAT